MFGSASNSLNAGQTLKIFAFRLRDQEYCVRTTTICEIRRWVLATPVSRAPAEVLGVMNLRRTIIPIIDLAMKLGMRRTEPN